MHLPNSGRIVLIDDRIEEIKPLLDALGKANVPYIYYDGSISNLPPTGEQPGGIRFVFLDIELHGMAGQSRKTKASALTSILKRIISISNGPYVIIFWTKHEGTIDVVLENCSTSNIAPVAVLNLEKNRWLKKSDKEAAEFPEYTEGEIEKISAALKEKLISLGAFRLYIEWENIVHSSSKQFISEFSSLVSSGDNWSQDTGFLFYNLYTAVVSKNTIDDQAEQFRFACHLMNRSFQDILSEETFTKLSLPNGFNLSPGVISDETKAKLNTSLFTGIPIIQTPMPGNVYLDNHDILLDSLKNHLFKKDKAPNDTKLCCVIVTPECDLAQNKLIQILPMKPVEGPLHRVILGLFYEISEDRKTEMKKLNDRGKDGRFDIGPLWYENTRYLLSLHAATLSFKAENYFSEAPLFRLKRDLLFDLLSKSANHINRLGNYQLF